MRRGELDDLAAFATVATEGSFTRAAARLDMSQSALSRRVQALEQRLGVRLLSRTTRSVSTTEAGEALLGTLRTAFADIDTRLAVLREGRTRLAGTLRLTMVKHAAMSLIRPMLPGFLSAHPDVRVELDVNDRFVDIVSHRFDAGIRFGEQVAKDMIAVRVGPEVRAAVVASPGYLAARRAPRTPRELHEHRCINYRLGTTGGLYAWEFQERGRRLEVRVDNTLVFNDGDLMVAAALDGQGIAYVFEHQVANHLAEGRLVRLLEKWCPPFPGYYLYHPSRRQTPPVLAAFIQALRARSAS
ncbi:LysR family transcriptional regulator [Archangium gephyra]|nr:LysR family transcriptional regulator [Archangium gephyra]